MPNIKSAKKRVKVIATKTAQNKANRSALRTQIKKANVAIETGAADKDEAVRAAVQRKLTRPWRRDSCTRIPPPGESPPSLNAPKHKRRLKKPRRNDEAFVLSKRKPEVIRHETHPAFPSRRSARVQRSGRGCGCLCGVGDDVTDRHFLQGVLSGEFPSRMEFRRCRFDGVRDGRQPVRPRRFCGRGVFRRDLSGAELSGCGFLRCRFENCKGVGTAFVHSPMRHVVLEGSPLRMANFSETPFKAVRFSGCDLTESVFLQCVPQDLSFESCKLVKINFCRTRLAGIDFSANQLEGILISGDELRDAVVSPLQAVELARLLGVRVKDG